MTSTPPVAPARFVRSHRRPTVPRPRTGLVLGAGVALLVVAAGTTAALAVERPFLLATLGFLVALALVELVRVTRPAPPPWWVAQLAILPWGALVLLPWAVRRTATATWIAAQTPLRDLDLPLTRDIHLLALLGLTAGTVLALVLPAARGGQQTAGGGALSWSRVAVGLSAPIALFGLSFVLAGRPLSALWRLGGDVLYAVNVDTEQGIAFLDSMPVVATIAFLVAVAVRRRQQERPPVAEVVLLVALAILLLGLGVRSRLYILALGWLVAQYGPSLARTSRRAERFVVAAVCGIAALYGAAYGAVAIASLRSGVEASNERSMASQAVDSLDVIGTTEALLLSGARVGELAGRSYTELPLLFVPRRFLPDKPGPASDELMRQTLSETAGFSAPAWVEPVLNFSTGAAFAFGALYALVIISVLRRLQRLPWGLAGAAAALGPVWLLVSYQLLSRLTSLQLLTSFVSITLGLVIGAQVTRPPRRERADSPADPAAATSAGS